MAGRKIKTDYTTTTTQANCRVYTLEFITELDNTDATEAVHNALDRLRHTGVAEIISERAVIETFDEACAILSNRNT